MNRFAADSARLTLMGAGAVTLLLAAIAAIIGTLEFPLTGIAPWDGALAYLAEVFGSVNAGASITGSVGFGSLIFLPLAVAGFLNWSSCQLPGVSASRLLAQACRFVAAFLPVAALCRTVDIAGSALLPAAPPCRTAAYTAAHLSGAAPRLE